MKTMSADLRRNGRVRCDPKAVAVFVVLSCLVGGYATADSADKGVEKAVFQAELDALKRTRPVEFEQAKLLFTLTTELLLARLGYGVGPFDGQLDEATATALRSYERSRSIAVTGDPLTFETMESVRLATAALDQTLAYLPERQVSTDLWDQGYASASGTWTLAGEDQGFPQQTSRLECHRDTGRCTEATAFLTDAGLSVDVETYEIERWDRHELVTKPLDVGLGCTRYVKRIARLQKAASGTRSTVSTTGVCKGVDQTEKYLLLADGSETHRKLQDRQRAVWRDLMLVAPDLLAKLGPGETPKR